MSICVYGLKGTGSTDIGRTLITPYRFKKCDNLQIPYISFVVHRELWPKYSLVHLLVLDLHFTLQWVAKYGVSNSLQSNY